MGDPSLLCAVSYVTSFPRLAFKGQLWSKHRSFFNGLKHLWMRVVAGPSQATRWGESHLLNNHYSSFFLDQWGNHLQSSLGLGRYCNSQQHIGSSARICISKTCIAAWAKEDQSGQWDTAFPVWHPSSQAKGGRESKEGMEAVTASLLQRNWFSLWSNTHCPVLSHLNQLEDAVRCAAHPDVRLEWGKHCSFQHPSCSPRRPPLAQESCCISSETAVIG